MPIATRFTCKQADQAVRIGEALPAQSYLNIPAIIAAAKASGADAVHPGYGFLAENEDFAQACKDAGLVFIGPSPQAIEAMGNKAGAKEIMKKAGVPVVPGYQGADQGDEVMLAEAKKIGFPVMIKAVAGGGGRGMRLVTGCRGIFPDALRSARSEAKAAFGDPTVILERAIQNPRHIEIQVFGDSHGNAIHLGERDCSVQRRHQKLIEEAPSPAVTPELRAKMGEVAVAAVKALRYEGAGTLEFLLDASGEFYFMEMNTRLQVEHPVTEAITGLDLVELQLRVARGEPLPVKQQDIRFSGHAIEVRLCSEDAAHDFMPQSGRMARWQVPDGIRVEHALQSGSEIPPFYDSMIAKVISHGATREEARGRLIVGLEQLTAIRRHHQPGVPDVVPASSRLCQRRGDHGVHRCASRRVAGAARGRRIRYRRLAGLLLYVTNPQAPAWRSGRSLAATFPLPAKIEIAGHAHELEVTRERDGSYIVAIDGRQDKFEIDQLDPDAIRFRHDGVMDSAKFLRDGDRLYLQHRGIPLAVDRSHPRRAEGRRKQWRRRQGPRRHERPRRRRSGQARRPRHRRSAGADAGSDEDGARPQGRHRRRRRRDRRRRGRAGDDGQDRGGDRGGVGHPELNSSSWRRPGPILPGSGYRASR